MLLTTRHHISLTIKLPELDSSAKTSTTVDSIPPGLGCGPSLAEPTASWRKILRHSCWVIQSSRNFETWSSSTFRTSRGRRSRPGQLHFL